MNLVFEDNAINSEIKRTVEKLISRNGKKSGKISVEYIPESELDCYEDEDGFIKTYGDECEIYMVYEDLRTWKQPLTMIAVMN